MRQTATPFQDITARQIVEAPDALLAGLTSGKDVPWLLAVQRYALGLRLARRRSQGR